MSSTSSLRAVGGFYYFVEHYTLWEKPQIPPTHQISHGAQTVLKAKPCNYRTFSCPVSLTFVNALYAQTKKLTKFKDWDGASSANFMNILNYIELQCFDTTWKQKSWLAIISERFLLCSKTYGDLHGKRARMSSLPRHLGHHSPSYVRRLKVGRESRGMGADSLHFLHLL